MKTLKMLCSKANITLMILATTMTSFAAADYTWSKLASGSYSLTDALNWTPSTSLPGDINTIEFPKTMAGDITLTASADLFVKSFASVAPTKPLNLVLDLHPTAQVGDPLRTLQASATSSLNASNITVSSGRIVATSGTLSISAGEGGQVVVDGPNTIIEAPINGTQNNGKYFNFGSGSNRSLIFQNGAQVKGTLIAPYADRPGTNRLVRFSGEGTRMEGAELILGRGYAFMTNDFIVESHAVVNATNAVKFMTQHTSAGNRFIVRDYAVVNTKAFSCNQANNFISISNATLNSENTLSSASDIDILQGGFVWSKEMTLANGVTLHIHPGGELKTQLFSFANRTVRTTDVTAIVDGGRLMATNALNVGYYDHHDPYCHHGMRLIVQNGGELIVTNGYTQSYCRNTSVGYNSGECSIVVTNASSFVLKGAAAKLEIGYWNNRRGPFLPSNCCVRVHQSLLDCDGDIFLSGHHSQLVFDDATVTAKNISIGQITSSYVSNNVIRVSGANTSAYVKNGCKLENGSSLIFDVPATGFNHVPLAIGGEAGTYQKMKIDPSTTIEINAKDYQRQSREPIALVQSAQGFDGLELSDGAKKYVTNLDVVVNGEAAMDAVLYVANGVADQPTLYAKLPKTGGLRIYIR